MQLSDFKGLAQASKKMTRRLIGTGGWLLLAGLASCGGPDRLTEADISAEQAKQLVAEQALNPPGRPGSARPPLPPRRQPLQVQHAPQALSDPHFIKQVTGWLGLDDGVPAQMAKGQAPDLAPDLVHDLAPHLTRLVASRKEAADQKQAATGQQLASRLAPLLAELQQTEAQLAAELLEAAATADRPQPGLRALIRQDSEGWLRLADLSGQLDFAGPDSTLWQLRLDQVALLPALQMICAAAGCQLLASAGVEAQDRPVSLHLTGSAPMLMQAVASQWELVLWPDATSGLVTVMLQEEWAARQARLSAYINQQNSTRRKRLHQEQLHRAVRQTEQMLQAAGYLARGDTKAWQAGLAALSGQTDPLSQPARQIMQETARELAAEQAAWQAQTRALLAAEQTRLRYDLPARLAAAGYPDLLKADSCLSGQPARFIEKIALYHKPPEAVASYLSGYFEAQSIELAEPQEKLQKTCPDRPAGPVIQADATGLVISARADQLALASRLVEAHDIVTMQVLVEIFMVTVSRDFKRQLENILSAPSNFGAGGSGTVEAQLLNSLSSAVSSGYSVQLSSPGNSISSVLKFLESNALGRVLSSPTILVEANGGEATITRKSVAEVLLAEPVYDNSSRVIGTRDVNTTLEAPLELHLSGVQVLPATHNVRMQVRITNRQFLASVSAITRKEEADYTEDTIDTVFTAAPGDIIVLAGLTSAEDGTSSSGLPGITGAAPGLGGLLGGSDQITNKLSEMVVFLAPTVIDPASDPQPHAAFAGPR